MAGFLTITPSSAARARGTPDVRGDVGDRGAVDDVVGPEPDPQHRLRRPVEVPLDEHLLDPVPVRADHRLHAANSRSGKAGFGPRIQGSPHEPLRVRVPRQDWAALPNPPGRDDAGARAGSASLPRSW